MKTLGIILAGGKSTRLLPATKAISKQLLPVYDKPMVYYPLSVLMLADIHEYLLICTPEDLPIFQRLFKDVKEEFGITMVFAPQFEPNGIAEAFIIAEKLGYRHHDGYALILGDNIFYGATFSADLDVAKAHMRNGEAVIFTHTVTDPKRFGVVEYGVNDEVIDITEKPEHPKSNTISTGLYFYPNDVIEIAKKLKPSKRGELEITDLNNRYLKEYRLAGIKMKRGMSWFDCGTPDSLLEASHFIQTIQHNQACMVADLKEIAQNNGWI